MYVVEKYFIAFEVGDRVAFMDPQFNYISGVVKQIFPPAGKLKDDESKVEKQRYHIVTDDHRDFLLDGSKITFHSGTVTPHRTYRRDH